MADQPINFNDNGNPINFDSRLVPVYSTQKCLFHFNSDFSDSGDSNVVDTNTGVTIDNSTYKFNGGSSYFNSTSYIHTTTNSSLNVASNEEFTLDTWFYPVRIPGQGGVTLPNNVFQLGPLSGTQIRFAFTSRTNPNSGMTFITPDLTWNTSPVYIPLNTWHHLAIVRECFGSSFKYVVYLDGIVYYDSGIVGNTASSANFSDGMFFGVRSDILNPFDSAFFYYGYLDEFSFISGARWRSNFTPPTQEYTSGILSYTDMPINFDSKDV